MLDLKHLSALSGLKEDDMSDMSDMNEVFELLDTIKEADFQEKKREAVGTKILRADEPKNSFDKAEIMKNSKNGLKIPRIV